MKKLYKLSASAERVRVVKETVHSRDLMKAFIVVLLYSFALSYTSRKTSRRNSAGEEWVTKVRQILQKIAKNTPWHMDKRGCRVGLNMRRLAKQTDCTWMTMRQKIGASRQRQKNEKQRSTRALKYAGRLRSWWWAHVDAACSHTSTSLSPFLSLLLLLILFLFHLLTHSSRCQYIDRGQSRQHPAPQPLTICLFGSSLPSPEVKL